MLKIMRRILAPEWKYITEPPRPHPQKFYFKFTLNLETTDLDLENKKQKMEFHLKTENSHAWVFSVRMSHYHPHI